MSERLTAIELRSTRDAGLAEWGLKTAPEMISLYRAYAEKMKRDAEIILAASDDDFRVQTYLGPHSQRNRVVIQEGSPKAQVQP